MEQHIQPVGQEVGSGEESDTAGQGRREMSVQNRSGPHSRFQEKLGIGTSMYVSPTLCLELC